MGQLTLKMGAMWQLSLSPSLTISFYSHQQWQASSLGVSHSRDQTDCTFAWVSIRKIKCPYELPFDLQTSRKILCLLAQFSYQTYILYIYTIYVCESGLTMLVFVQAIAMLSILQLTFNLFILCIFSEHIGACLFTHNGWRPLLHRPWVFRAPGHLRFRLRYLGRWESGAVLQDVDVRWHTWNCALLTCRSHLPQTFTIQGKCSCHSRSLGYS